MPDIVEITPSSTSAYTQTTSNENRTGLCGNHAFQQRKAGTCTRRSSLKSSTEYEKKSKKLGARFKGWLHKTPKVSARKDALEAGAWRPMPCGEANSPTTVERNNSTAVGGEHRAADASASAPERAIVLAQATTRNGTSRPDERPKGLTGKMTNFLKAQRHNLADLVHNHKSHKGEKAEAKAARKEQHRTQQEEYKKYKQAQAVEDGKREEMQKARNAAEKSADKFIDLLVRMQSDLHHTPTGLRQKAKAKIKQMGEAIPDQASVIAAGELVKFLQSLDTIAGLRDSGPDQTSSEISVGLRVLAKVMKDKDSDTLTAIRLAAKDLTTRDRLVEQVERRIEKLIKPQSIKKESAPNAISIDRVKDAFDAIAEVGLRHARYSYQIAPFQTLVALTDECSRALETGERPPSDFPSRIAQQLHLIHRGYNEPGLVHPDETRIGYLERILQHFTGEEPRHASGDDPTTAAASDEQRETSHINERKKLALLFAVGDIPQANVLRQRVLNNATSKPLELHYAALFDRLTRLLARELHDNPVAISHARPEAQSWPELNPPSEVGPIRPVTPYYPPTRLHRIGRSMWFWIKYCFSGGESCAQQRLEYWQDKVDQELRGLLARMGRTRDHDLDAGVNTRTRNFIDGRIRRLHDALDCMQIELELQQSDRSASDYLQSSLVQRYAELGDHSLRNIWAPVLGRGWQPELQPRSRWSIRAAHLKNLVHPFRKASALSVLREVQQDHATRMTQTWHTLRTTLRAQIMDQSFTYTIKELATALRQQQHDNCPHNNDRLASAVLRLAELDARMPAEAPLTPPDFQQALKYLTDKDLASLKETLAKYSWDNGRNMDEVLKLGAGCKVSIADNNRFYLRWLLERLHETVSIVANTRPSTASTEGQDDSIAISSAQAANAPAIGVPAAPPAIEAQRRTQAPPLAIRDAA